MIPSKTTNHRSLRGYGVWGVLALLLWSGAVPLKHGALLQAGEALDDWKAAKQQFLLGIKTKDADAVLDASQALTYSISGQDVTGAFVVDPDSGVISVGVGSSLDFETDALHDVTVQVQDVSGIRTKKHSPLP